PMADWPSSHSNYYGQNSTSLLQNDGMVPIPPNAANTTKIATTKNQIIHSNANSAPWEDLIVILGCPSLLIVVLMVGVVLELCKLEIL
ncbi:hypothetical protein MKX03_014841, partial [Papaver bracteatum]